MDDESDPLLPRNNDGKRRREKVVTEEVSIWVLSLVTAMAVASGSAAVDAALMPARTAGQARSLLWAAAGEHASVDVPGCTATLLSLEWALLAARCIPSGKGAENTLTLHAPRWDDQGTPEEDGNMQEGRKQWTQQRRVVEVVLSSNEDLEKGAAPYPALALVRAESPFRLGTLQPASLLWGPLEDARRPLRCSIAGWDVMGDEKNLKSVYPSDITSVTIGRVMTYSQCGEHEGLVERPSQFCVEVVEPTPAVKETVTALGMEYNASEEASRTIQRKGLIGNPLLCAGALVGVRFLRSGLPGLSASRDPTSTIHYRVDVFTNATHLEPWIREHVKDISVISPDGGVVVAPDVATHAPPSTRRSHGSRFFGHSAAAGPPQGLPWVWYGLLATCLAGMSL